MIHRSGDDPSVRGDATRKRISTLREELALIEKRGVIVPNEKLEYKPTPGGSRAQGWLDPNATPRIDEEEEWRTDQAFVASVGRNVQSERGR